MKSNISKFSDNYKESSYWLDDLSPTEEKNNRQHELPDQTDLLIVGSGYTGLNAAIETAKNGLKTVVVDEGELGQGCSTKNGGQISTSIKPSLKALTEKYGTEKATAIRREGLNALSWIEELISHEKLNCDFMKSGRFHGAHTRKQYEKMCSSITELAKENITAHPIQKNAISSEIGTDFYHGGLVFPDNASLHPAKYHRELIHVAKSKGSLLVDNCKALSINKDNDRFIVSTTKGDVIAKQLAVATNGYTSSLTPWLKRRIIPIGSYIIATESLDTSIMDRLFPTDRMITDSRKVVFYYRPSPDRTKILFGGRVSAGETDPSKSGPKLIKDLVRLFPELNQVQISHSWTGTVAYSFDELAHFGRHNGMHYAMSYCGSGVSMASYLGMKMGRKISEAPNSETAFDGLKYPSRPYYFGNPWFLPLAVEWYRLTDRLLC